MAAFQQAQSEGLCLRYPDPLGMHAQISQENAVQMLLRAIQLSNHTPFAWGYIDKPPEGQLFLIFQMPNYSFPLDGLVYQDREQRYSIPAGAGRELEVMEVKFGFIPGADNTAFRVRRRYRLSKGGHPQLVLVHYSRGQQTAIVPTLNMPPRQYPLRVINEPSIFVLGEKQGQKAFPPGAVPPGPGERPGGNMSYPMGMPGNPQAMLAHQNSSMEALERRAARDRSGSINARQGQTREDDDSGDESEQISTRTLALSRYRRNHEVMNEVFMFAAFGNKRAVQPPPPFSIFKRSELEEKIAKLTADVEELKAKSAARQEAAAGKYDAGDISMEFLPEGTPIAV